MDIVDRVAVVTGAGSGLGRATALALAKAGARVAVLDRNAEGARSVAEEAGVPAVAVTVDVADRASVTAAIAEVSGAFGRIDVCVNAAGIPNPGKVFGKSGPLDIEQFQRVINVNLVGAFDVMRQCAELMTRNTDPGLDGERGVIINVSSGAAFEGQKGQAAYSASKAGLIGLMLPAARDLAQYGIRVMTIAPGLFETPMLQSLPPEAQKSLGESVPFPQRLGTPAEYAALALHIIANRMLNGETIRLDGALRMAPR